MNAAAAATLEDLPANLKLFEDDLSALEKPPPRFVENAGMMFASEDVDDESVELRMKVGNFLGDHDEFVDEVVLDRRVFGIPERRDLMQQVVRWQLAKRRQGTHATKNISEVSGSGKKPWRQKGTGRARVGSRRPPHWRGGAAHGARRVQPRDYSYKLNKKVRRLGLCSVLATKLREGRLHVIEDLQLDTHKTVDMANRLAEREWDSVAIIDSHEELGDSAQLAARNLNYVELLTERGANVYSLLKRRELVLTKSGLDALTARLLAPIAR